MKQSDPIGALKGVGPKKQAAFAESGIETIGDLLTLTPRRYEDRRTVTPVADLVPGKPALTELLVRSRRFMGYAYKKKSPLVLRGEDDTGSIEIVFFNGSYLANQFQIGRIYSFYGIVSENRGRLQMIHPEFHPLGHPQDVRGLIPVYPAVHGISAPELRRLIRLALDEAEGVTEWIPPDIVVENDLPDAARTIRCIHSPKNEKEAAAAEKRLLFEELFVLETGLLYSASDATKRNGIRVDPSAGERFRESLPFEFTEGQARVWREIAEDLESPKAMNRLVQGDVGSGKTAVAEAAMVSCAKCGVQSAFMAPTEILAKQHLQTLRKDFQGTGVRVDLLTGSLKGRERKDLLERLGTGEIDVLIGTHALLQPDVVFANLGLVVTDEQHRFGVAQRRALTEKGRGVNVMVMTATPIPRTIAVVLYGDLDYSAIDTMPVSRKPVLTKVVSKSDRRHVYSFVKGRLREGRQAYIVAPLIEESEKIDAVSAEALYREMERLYPEYRVELLHGALSQEEKDRVMERFAAGEIDLLVTTVVIEVGINVPNATVIVIENCERFGLAQMHQLRGRVGRGSEQSYCYLVLYHPTEIAEQRAAILTETQDGFRIAEEDLKLRGPGELFGTQQHGLSETHLLDILRDEKTLGAAKRAAEKVLKRDARLNDPENAGLRRRVERLFGKEIRMEL